jgi:hypothetical protein
MNLINLKFKALSLITFSSIVFLISCQKNEPKEIFQGGWAIVLCAHHQSDCRISEDEVMSRQGVFSTQWSCEAAVKHWKDYGVKRGNPRCIPCSAIVIEPGVLDDFRCVWRK